MGRVPRASNRRRVDQAKLEAAGQKRLFGPPAQPITGRRRISGVEKPIWTENKANLIERYLYYFVQITKHGSYIDGFAGPQRVGPSNWSAKLVLESTPKWLRHFFLCELKNAPYVSLERLRDSQPTVGKGKAARTIELFHGDFNEEVHKILRSQHLTQKEATFCLLDQRTFQCHWSTVETLARHKRAGTKIELFYFLAAAWFDRAFSGIKDSAILDRWWGRDDWKALRRRPDLERAQTMCDRMKTDLGYKYTSPYEIRSRKQGGRVMYYMIHASDHDEAPYLMTRAYNRAVYPKETGHQLKLLLNEVQAMLPNDI